MDTLPVPPKSGPVWGSEDWGRAPDSESEPETIGEAGDRLPTVKRRGGVTSPQSPVAGGRSRGCVGRSPGAGERSLGLESAARGLESAAQGLESAARGLESAARGWSEMATSKERHGGTSIPRHPAQTGEESWWGRVRPVSWARGPAWRNTECAGAGKNLVSYWPGRPGSPKKSPS